MSVYPGSPKEQFIGSVLRESDRMIWDKVRSKWFGMENIASGIVPFPWRFNLKTGGFVEFGAVEKPSVTTPKKGVAFRLQYQNSEGELEQSPIFTSSGLNKIEGLEGEKLSKEQVSAVRRALALIEPKNDFILEGVDWKNLPLMKALDAIHISGEDLPWSEEIGKLELLRIENYEDLASIFPNVNLTRTFGADRPQRKLILFFQALGAEAPSPATTSLDNFFHTVVSYVMETMPNFSKTELSPEERRMLDNIVDFTCKNGFAFLIEGKDGNRLVLNPHVTSWAKRVIPEEIE
ncbi:MAG: hypothetical protein AAB887_01535 [Patescibacteria group bacterium]